MDIRVVIEKYGEEIEETVSVDNDASEEKIAEVLNDKFGIKNWLAYNIEP